MAINKKNKMLIAASIAGLIAAAGAGVMSPSAFAATGELEHCSGINACKGMGACGGKGHSCAGKNACKGQGYVDVAKGSCMKIQGGSLTAV
jgi:uncharacterized membrane protein